MDRTNCLLAQDDAKNTQGQATVLNKKLLQKGKTYLIRGADWKLLDEEKTNNKELVFRDGWKICLLTLTCQYTGKYTPANKVYIEDAPQRPSYSMH